jgi:hypothetical protein
VLTLFASQGYVVVAPVHADSRNSDIRLETLNDDIDALAQLTDYTP